MSYHALNPDVAWISLPQLRSSETALSSSSEMNSMVLEKEGMKMLIEPVNTHLNSCGQDWLIIGLKLLSNKLRSQWQLISTLELKPQNKWPWYFEIFVICIVMVEQYLLFYSLLNICKEIKGKPY